MFGEECTLPMDIGLPRRQPHPPEDITSLYAVWVKDSLEVAFDQVRRHSGQAVQRQKRLYDQRAVRRLFAIGDWIMRYYPAGKKCKLDYLDWPLSHSGYPRLDGGHSETPRRAGDFHPLSGREEDPPNPVGRSRGLKFTRRGAPRRFRCWVLALWPTLHGTRPRLLLCLRGSCAPFRITVRVDMQVFLRMIAGGRH